MNFDWQNIFSNKANAIKSKYRQNKLSLLLLLLLTVPIARAQHYLKGTVANQQEVEGIHILNLQSRYSTITNDFGNFEIPAQRNDTLLVSSIQYMPQTVVVSQEMIDKGAVVITLTEQVNELDEVVLGHSLTGDIERDSRNIPTEKPLNFDDVGIPGFLGKPEEKIVPAYTLYAPTALNIEALYNHLSGYYKKLRTKRKWDAENQLVAHIINSYGTAFFEEAYGIPENRLYDFILFCMETTSLKADYNRGNYAGVLESFQTNGAEYLVRLDTSGYKFSEKKE
jgi:hypothetical protein